MSDRSWNPPELASSGTDAVAGRRSHCPTLTDSGGAAAFEISRLAPIDNLAIDLCLIDRRRNALPPGRASAAPAPSMDFISAKYTVTYWSRQPVSFCGLLMSAMASGFVTGRQHQHSWGGRDTPHQQSCRDSLADASPLSGLPAR